MKPVLIALLLLAIAAVLAWMVAARPRMGRRDPGNHPLPPARRERGDGTTEVRERRDPADDGRLYASLVDEMRRVTAALEWQARKLDALRVDFRDRLRAIEDRLGGTTRPASPATWAGARGGGEAETRSTDRGPDAVMGPPEGDRPGAANGLDGVETHAIDPLAPVQPAAAAPASGRPVEGRGGGLVISHSLPPAAYAVPEGPGRARVYLNDQVEINEYALPKWEAFFEMRGARAYATYRTLRPAEVEWDASAERGVPDTPGIAEAV